MNNYAYITVLSTNNYLCGCILLIETGKRTNSKYPFYCIVTDNIDQRTKDILKTVGYQLIEEPLFIPKSYGTALTERTDIEKGFSQGSLDSNGGHFAGSKLLAFKQTQFDKILLLDCDIMFLKNFDHVLENYGHLTAVTEGGTVQAGKPRMMSAVLLIEPSIEEYNNLINYVEENPVFEKEGKIILNSDMYAINEYSQWYKYPEKHLPYYYLFESSRFDPQDSRHYYGMNGDKVYAVHFNSFKPGLEKDEVFNQYIGTEGDNGAVIHKYGKFLLKIILNELGTNYGIELILP